MELVKSDDSYCTTDEGGEESNNIFYNIRYEKKI